MERAIEDREVIEITRRGHEPVALVAMSELRSLMETAHLLRSPKNAERLLSALEKLGRNDRGIAMTMDELRQRLGLSAAETGTRGSKDEE
jgi:antitoxin YefM